MRRRRFRQRGRGREPGDSRQARLAAATGLLMRLRRAKREDRLDTELRQIAKARLLIIDEFGYMPIDRTVRHGRLTGFEGGSYRSEHALMTR